MMKNITVDDMILHHYKTALVVWKVCLHRDEKLYTYMYTKIYKNVKLAATAIL